VQQQVLKLMFAGAALIFVDWHGGILYVIRSSFRELRVASEVRANA
jgi:hypothetical protein